ncbi:50S ribosomal protein L10 [Symbiobacterium thermophilum]|uniref:Large ribosomal subunit protein uL10 n=2 Tax=Symbiobacterium thermophilum TaxID=2734 RepID=RL10_SYMTH|nr:50S ribosomal protein L10 [Symbiobacterium thermophilum]Q67JT1.1 RecName: Full=Large ribosomal subunit protein uL10; AltName: Full=50S ribosomal protein L10 [Symbiobacterium thermophilum IAM 14863]MBY6274742.1 50S ribosomal protein L10 [Symbiobacterium thermophilum]BAD42069.1 50S ribosomal protein L10 [Symbiobacterium thermophilum IAM 14863]
MRTIRPEKQQAVAELKEALQNAKSVVLADNLGLTVAQVTQLRRELRQAGVELKVAKNTLIGIAARELGIEGLEPYLHGTTTLAFSYEDEAAGAKKIREFFAKEREPKFVMKAGILEGKVIDADGVKALADLPNRETLLAQVLAGIQAPLQGVAGAINGLLASFAYALDARIRQLEGAEA